MKVLFIGGTGTISAACSELAVQQGIDLYLLNRGNRSELVPKGACTITADIYNSAEVAKALTGHFFDAIVDWIAFTPEHVERDIELFAGKTRQYIFISSTSVYQKPSSLYKITESTPLANPFWEYSRNKIACEDRLLQEYRENDFPVTIVRPSHTYGNSSIPWAFHGKSPWTIIDRMQKGKKIIVHGDGTSLWSLTHNSDFAKAFNGLLGNTQSIGHAFHITSDEVLTWNQILQAIGRAAGVTPDIINISSNFIVNFHHDSKGTLLGDKANSVVFDNTKIKTFVPDFVATTRFEEGIKQSIAWFEAHPEKCTPDTEWDALCDKIIAAYQQGLSLSQQ